MYHWKFSFVFLFHWHQRSTMYRVREKQNLDYPQRNCEPATEY